MRNVGDVSQVSHECFFFRCRGGKTEMPSCCTSPSSQRDRLPPRSESEIWSWCGDVARDGREEREKRSWELTFAPVYSHSLRVLVSRITTLYIHSNIFSSFSLSLHFFLRVDCRANSLFRNAGRRRSSATTKWWRDRIREENRFHVGSRGHGERGRERAREGARQIKDRKNGSERKRRW